MPAAATASTPLESITWGSVLPDTDVSVYFVPAGEDLGDFTSEGASAYEIGQFRRAFDIIEAITNVTFEIVEDSDADFKIAIDDDELLGSLDGKMEPPGEDGAGEAVFDGKGIVRGPGGTMDEGGYDFMVIVHELMHGMGLAHPHDDGGGSAIMDGVDEAFGDYGDFDLNQGTFSVMTYNNGYFTGTTGSTPDSDGQLYGYEAGPMAFDIAVLQAKYGANMTTATGDNVYELPDQNASGTKWVSIWDAGGTDEIRYSGSKDASIDLREATLKYEAGGGGWISAADGIAGGFTIANGVDIENATGGSGKDTITGNDLDNVLRGNAGKDSIFGGDGNDTINGGKGADAIDGGDGVDTLDFADATGAVYADLERGAGYRGDAMGDTYANMESINGSDFNDILVASSSLAGTISGGKGNDTLKNGGAATGGADGTVLDGGDGRDTLISYGGETTMNGGRGADRFTGSNDHDTVDFSGATSWVYVDLARGKGFMGDSRGDTYSKIDSITGSDFNDILVASSSLAGKISGGKGNDTLKNGGAATGGADGTVLDGGEGNDTLTSYGGNTTFDGGKGNDKKIGGSGVDTFVFRTGEGNDRVENFESGPGSCDILDFTAHDTFAGTDLATVLSFSTDVGRDMVIDDGEGGVILLANVNSVDLHMDNLLL